MSTDEEAPDGEERRQRRSSNDEKSERRKKKKLREEGELRSSREASSSSNDTKKKKKRKDGSVREGSRKSKEERSIRDSRGSSREKKKKKRPKEAEVAYRETPEEILARLESKGTLSTLSGSTRSGSTRDTLSTKESEPSLTAAGDSSSRERKKKHKSSKDRDESSSSHHRSKKSKDRDETPSRRSKKKSSKERKSASRESLAESDDLDKKPKAAPRSQEEEDVKIDAQVEAFNMGNESTLYSGDASMQVAPSSFTTPGAAASSGVSTKRRGSATDNMFTVRKAPKDGGKRWDDYSNMKQDDSESNQFSSASISSGFSMPASSRALGSKGDATRVGAIPSSNVPDRVQNLLDRKFNEYGDRQGESTQPVGYASASSLVGAHHEAAVPDRIQNMLDQKFNEFGQSTQGLTISAEASQVLSPVQSKVQAFQPTYVTNIPASPHGKLQASSEDNPELNRESQRNLAPVARQFSMWNTGAEKTSVATPAPDVLANQMLEDQEMALSGVEKTEARLAAGLCPDCGRTKTHEKIKYGPFQAFRKMEPLTTPGHVYKGHCLFCNNLHDLRRVLHEPYLREQDIDGSLTAPLSAGSTEDDKVATRSAMSAIPPDFGDQEFARKKRRVQLCLCIAVLAVIGGGIGLAITFVGNNDNAGVTATGAAPPPSPAPGPIGWHQMGPGISEPIPSFGYKVSIADKGDRVAVSSPLDGNSAGRVDVFEYLNTSSQWEAVGQPILGDFENDMCGYAMDFSGDGKHMVIGCPANDNGFVRVYRSVSGEWKQTGSTIKGTTLAGWFGAAVAITPEGKFVAVGAPYDTNENGSEAGRVRVFTLQDEDWVQVGDALLGRATLDHFGISVDLSDDGVNLGVGAPNNDDRWQDGGQVHVFESVKNNEGIFDWKESLTKSLKILGDEEGHEFGSAMSLSGFGDMVISSSLLATNKEGTAGGGDPRSYYIAYIDDVAEEVGYGFPEIPGTQGLGQSVDIDYDGTKVILSTLNLETVAGKAMLFDIQGKANWFTYSDEYGGEELGPDEWLGDGPSVSLGDGGNFFAIGYESIVVDRLTKEAAPIVRVYYYGHGPSEEEDT